MHKVKFVFYSFASVCFIQPDKILNDAKMIINIRLDIDECLNIKQSKSFGFGATLA